MQLHSMYLHGSDCLSGPLSFCQKQSPIEAFQITLPFLQTRLNEQWFKALPSVQCQV